MYGGFGFHILSSDSYDDRSETRHHLGKCNSDKLGDWRRRNDDTVSDPSGV
jgi:hypothetical protein